MILGRRPGSKNENHDRPVRAVMAEIQGLFSMFGW